VLLGRLRVRGKLGLLLAAPLLGIVLLAVPVVGDRVGVASRADSTARTVAVAGQVGSLVQSLQQERMLSIGYLFDVVERGRLVLQSAQVADDIADLRATEGLPRDVAAALDALPALATLRAAVLDRQTRPDAVMSAFGTEVTRLINSLRLRTGADTATAAGRQVMALDSVLRADEGVSLVAVQIVLIAAVRDTATVAEYTRTMATLVQDLERFRAYATPEQNTLYSLVEQGANERSTTGDFLDRLSTDPLAAATDVPLRQLFPMAESLLTLGRFVEKRIVADVRVEVAAQQRRALTEAYAVGFACVLLLLCVVLLSIAVARAVARPLTRLTESAERVAEVAEAELTSVADDERDAPAPVRLEAVDVRARDEVGDLARAFERVQATAARLVERQVASRRNVAQMFGHVGRRTQNLVSRQLALIDRLERQETDPERLQHLYRLDHISSRLRRNASSLVVLSGSRGADSHMTPLPLADVVRLALGEIEAYLRVDIKVPTGISIAPSLIGDLVLALAELMENAATFSPPHTRVTVTAVVSDPGIRLLVVDRGLGMTPERMAEENARLAHRERLDLAPTEVLGLFVVGRLARRHGMRVSLTPTPGGGVTAEIEVDERHLVIDPSPADRSSAAPAAGPAPAPAGAADPPVPRPVPRRTAEAGPLLDDPALDRATRMLANGQPWNAFVPRPRSGDDPPPAEPDRPAQPDGPAAPAAGRPVPVELSNDETQMVLRRRVPGAQLPGPEPSDVAPPPPPSPADPAAARALVEEFEAGVRYAERQVRGGAVAGVPPARGNGHANGQRVPATTNGGEAAARPGQPLRRRQPGATLDEPPTPAERRTSGQALDAHAARDLVQQFENGVARAMRQISAGRSDQEGSR